MVDLGCADYGHQNSMQALCEMYRPSYLYGFDPNPELREDLDEVHGVPARLRQAAAWDADGPLHLIEQGTRSVVAAPEAAPGITVQGFDFSRWVAALKEPHLIVKMDIEGAEGRVLRHMIEQGTASLMETLLIEWHLPYPEREELLGKLHCQVVDWWM